MDYIIRPVRQDDIDALASVESICFPEAEAATKSSLRERIQSFPECFFVAETAGSIIGFINGMATDSTVIEDRNQGIAAALMNHIIADAKKKDRKGLILTCKEHLLHYYAKFGYENMGISNSVHGGAVWYDMILTF